MKKAKLVLLVAILCVVIAGCAAWQKAVSEVTPAQQTQIQGTISPVTGLIPQPYQVPATLAIGWFTCVLFNLGKDWWNKKTGKTA